MTLSLDPISAVLDIGSKIIERVWPDPVQAANAKLELLKLQQSGELAQIAGQLSINQVEAASSSIWVSGWRPFVGWIGGAGLAYAAILEPIGRFIASVAFNYNGVFPVLDTTITMQVLFGILGLGAMRSYDKKQGTST